MEKHRGRGSRFLQIPFRHRLAMLVGSVLLIGCSSVGVQYASADDVPDAAEIVGGGNVFINSVNDKGCYSGRTTLGKNFKLSPGRQVVLGHESQSAGMFCRALVAFTPEPSKRYVVVPMMEGTGKNLFGMSVGRRACRLSVLQVMGDGYLSFVATEPRRFQTGFACIRFVNPAAEAAEVER